MARKRPTIDKEDMINWFAPTGGRKPTPSDYKYPTHSYRVRDVTHDDMKDIAKKEGVGISDLVRYLFEQFIDGYRAGDIELPVEEYVVTKSRLSRD